VRSRVWLALPALVPDLAHEVLPADSGAGVSSASGEHIGLLGPVVPGDSRCHGSVGR
jgi:hypothetical protein